MASGGETNCRTHGIHSPNILVGTWHRPAMCWLCWLWFVGGWWLVVGVGVGVREREQSWWCVRVVCFVCVVGGCGWVVVVVVRPDDLTRVFIHTRQWVHVSVDMTPTGLCLCRAPKNPPPRPRRQDTETSLREAPHVRGAERNSKPSSMLTCTWAPSVQHNSRTCR